MRFTRWRNYSFREGVVAEEGVAEGGGGVNGEGSVAAEGLVARDDGVAAVVECAGDLGGVFVFRDPAAVGCVQVKALDADHLQE